MSALPRSRPRLALAALAVLFIAGLGIFGAIRVGAAPPASTAAAPPVEVDAAVVVQREIADTHAYSGRLAAVDRVDVRSLVSGTIVAVNIVDGAAVRKGDVLFVIDPRPYQAERNRASAQLAAAQARAEYLQRDWERAERLVADNAIARRDYDEKQHAAREANAQVQAAKAALDAADINLGHTRIVAPIAGRVSRAEITLGNVVTAGAGAAPLTSIVSVSPVYAEFDADEQTYLRYLGHAKRGGALPAELGLATEVGYPRRGTIQSVDNRLDETSGTIRIRARFDNADGQLVPGLYARVRIGSGMPHAALLVDDAAIGTDQSKKFVYVVAPSGRIEYREIQPGDLHGGLRVVTDGLRAGERIVVNGIHRVRPDAVVDARVVPMPGGSPLQAGATPGGSAPMTAAALKRNP